MAGLKWETYNSLSHTPLREETKASKSRRDWGDGGSSNRQANTQAMGGECAVMPEVTKLLGQRLGCGDSSTKARPKPGPCETLHLERNDGPHA